MVWPFACTAAKSRPSGATAMAEVGHAGCATATARKPAVPSTPPAGRGPTISAARATAVAIQTRTIIAFLGVDHARERGHGRKVVVAVRADQREDAGDHVLHV